MARAIWTGALSFGLVSIPVGLYSATEEHEVRFHQFERGTSSRIRYRRVNEDTGKEVGYDDIVKGAEVGDGEYVMLSDEDLESVEPGRSRTVDITDFVEAAEIDPIHYQKSYYLAPADETAAKPYGLLVAALTKADKIAVATFVMRSKEYLAAIRPSGDVLVLETMYFADEVRDPAEFLPEVPKAPSARGKDVQMAIDLIEAMTSRWDPANYTDSYTERVEQLVEAKRDDREVVTSTEPEEGGEVVDLVAALKASLDAARGHKPGNQHRREKLSTREAGADGEADLSSLSRDELYAMAQEVGLKGRSSMSRKQLLEALSEEGRRRAG
ncbi:Ku protein [Desertihabitans brevis]|uniref:Non-homologous end joining protein Ku n=1 Tax=Desertihabitans brevis TaxID=2268447 RepID=A0A367YUA1_9ACTN|nr:Ku protein [Desertihabitans brevis]RCK68602.1 Ku protein [Desertihabitans brevis]